MASGKLYNLAKMNTATTGTGTITLSTAASGFLTFAESGVSNGEIVTYIIEEGANRELGYGTYSTSGTTLTRNVLKSTNADSAINLSGAATVGITAARENFLEWFANIDANGFSLGMDDNTGINDDSGNETVRFRKTSSAVNYIEVLNTETAVGPRIAAAGDDTNIDLRLAAKGTGRVQIPNATLTTPALGTPASGTLPNCTGLPISTGVSGLGTNVANRLAIANGVREVLTGNRTYYVNNSTGSDSNDGLGTGTAFATIQKAYDVIVTLDLAGFTATISVAAGTYTAGLSCTVPPFGGNVSLTGAGATTIISTTSATAVLVSTPMLLTISEVKLQTTTSGNCIHAFSGGRVNIGSGVDFGACAGTAHITAQSYAYIQVTANYSITGAAARHVYCDGATVFLGSGRTVTITGSPTFSSPFIVCLSTGVVFVSSPTYSGSVTATRYSATLNGVINTFGGGASVFPGGTAGTTATGGQYA